MGLPTETEEFLSQAREVILKARRQDLLKGQRVESTSGGDRENKLSNRASMQKRLELLGRNIKMSQIRNAHEVLALKAFTGQYKTSAFKTERFEALAVQTEKYNEISIRKWLLHAFSNEH